MTPRHLAARELITNYRLLVIPLVEREKRPAFASGPNHSNLATLLPERIDGWWEFKDYNLGLPCTANRLAVVDVDGPDGDAHLAKLQREYGELPATWAQTSNRADRTSVQLIYEWPNGVLVPTGRLSTQLEVRAHGAQIVVPPSIHPSGSVYSWLTPPAPDRPRPTPLPDWVLDLLTLPAPPEIPTDAPVVSEPAGSRPGDDYNSRPTANGTVLTLLEAHGWKHAYTRDEVHYLVRPGKDIRDGISASLGHPNTGGGFYVFSTASNFEAGRRYSPFAVYTLLEHAGDWKAAAQTLLKAGYGEHPEPNPIILGRVHIPIDVDDDITPIIPASDRFPIDTWRATDLIPLADQPVDWLVKRIAVSGTYGLIGGQQKTLKTELMVAFDLAVLTGTPFLGDTRFPTGEPTPILLYLSEGGMVPYMRRLVRWAHALNVELPRSLYDYAVGFAGSKMTSGFLDELHKRIDTTGARLVRLDALYGFSGGDVEGASIFAMGDLLTGFSNIMTATGTTGFITHHFNETGRGSELTRFAMAGSAGWVDSWIMILHRSPPDPDQGHFHLGLRVGSRQWGENAWNLEVDLGRFDSDHGTHVGAPTIGVEEADWVDVAKWGRAARSNNGDEDADHAHVYQIIRDHPWQTKTQITRDAGQRKEKVLTAIANGLSGGHLIEGRLPVEEGDRVVKRTVYGAFDSIKPFGLEIEDPEP